MKTILLLVFTLAIFQGATFAQPCLSEGITLSSQSQIDQFQADHPGCTQIGGDVTITGYDVTNLAGLVSLTSIGGNLMIHKTQALVDLEGLNNLESVGGSLVIGDYTNWPGNHSLINLQGLESLQFIGVNLEVRDNFALVSMQGLEAVTHIGGSLVIENNPELTGIGALNALTSLGNNIEVSNNVSLSSLEGLNNVTDIGGALILSDNTSLASLNGLTGLEQVRNSLVILRNTSLSTLEGLDNLLSIGGEVWIDGNASLTSLAGLQGITEILYNVRIGFDEGTGNPMLISLEGLNNLQSIGGTLIIYNNDSLASLEGLESLEYIGIDLWIVNDTGLVSLAGLDNLVMLNGNLMISGNPNLCTCKMKCICTYLSAPNGFVEIQDNGTGCNSIREVEQACGITGIDDVENVPLTVISYPNPAADFIRFSLELAELQEITIKIYDMQGRLLSTPLEENEIRGKYELELNTNSLADGIYLLRLTTDKSQQSVASKFLVRH